MGWGRLVEDPNGCKGFRKGVAPTEGMKIREENKVAEEEWVMPDWMEKYREAMESFLGGRTMEQLNNNREQNLWNNAPGAAFCIAAHAVTAIFTKLHDEGKLPNP